MYTTESQVQAFYRDCVFVCGDGSDLSLLPARQAFHRAIEPHLRRGSKHKGLRRRVLPLFSLSPVLSPVSRAVTEESGKGWTIRAHFAKVALKLFKAKWWNRLERGMLLMLTAGLSGEVLGDTNCYGIPFMRFERRSLVAKESSSWSSLF